MPERVNAEISKRYDINPQEVGSGGYGKVFVAADRVTSRKVAIKKVIVHDEEKRKGFKKESSIMKSLDHPHICKLLETYDQGRFMFFVMEYCEGREVFDRIMDNGLISEASTADIARQCGSALKYAHERGIAHRDIKPENICFVTSDITNNQIKVIDWGLGFYFGEARMSSAVGSLTYAAPEVLEASSQGGYDAMCDVWSLGVVIYVMLCGKPPFWGNYNQQLKRMKEESYPMSDKTWQAVGSNAKDMIRAMLKADPRKRCSMDFVLRHPWLRETRRTDANISKEVLSNMRKFSNSEHFFNLCVASVARQLDHKSLTNVYQVFCDMDTDGDGVLTLEEVRAGFLKIYGQDHDALRDIDQLFANIDLDGSGTIDYTEFCAAGLGERVTDEESVLWAAFKAFDINDDDGKISKDEVIKVLAKGGELDNMWTRQVCEEVTEEVFKRYDRDGNGELDFQEFVSMMRKSKNSRQAATEPRTPQAVASKTILAEPGLQTYHQNYQALSDIRTGRSPAAGDRSQSTLMSSVSSRAAWVCGGSGSDDKKCAVM